jgi:hypothetical protein
MKRNHKPALIALIAFDCAQVGVEKRRLTSLLVTRLEPPQRMQEPRTYRKFGAGADCGINGVQYAAAFTGFTFDTSTKHSR